MGFLDPIAEDSVNTAGRLTDLCLRTVIKKLLVPLVPSKSSDLSLDARCNWDISTKKVKHFMSCLPTNLSLSILDEAHALLDNHHDVDQLLFIMLALLENSKTKVLNTPLYLYSSKAARTRLLEMLLDTDIVDQLREINLHMYNFYFRPGMVQSFEEEGELEFELQRVSLEECEKMLVEDLVGRSSYLTSLSLHTVADNNIINIISGNCPRLQYLDVSFAKNVSDDGIALLATSLPLQESLNVLKLENTSVTQAGIYLVLENLGNLINLESGELEDYLYSMQSFFCKSNLLDAALASPYPKHFKLRKLCLSLNRFQENKLSIFYVISLLFPELEEIKIHSLHPAEQENLHCLAHLHKLRSLLTGCLPLQTLVPLFSSLGSNLTSFSCIFYDRSGQSINMSVVSQLCPNLEFLLVSGNSLVYDAISPSSLAGLKQVMINVHAFIPRQIWQHIFRTCLKIKIVEFTKCEDLTDDSLEQILNSNPTVFSSLEKFNIKGSHSHDVQLSNRTVDAIKQRSKGIKYIGDCFTWSLQNKQHSASQIRSLL